MIDVATEKVMSLAAATRIVPPGRNGKRTHISTLVRWIQRGARGPAGDRIRLEAVRLGGRWLTSQEALQRFMERLTPALEPGQMAQPRTPAERLRSSERAGAELARLGI